ncbi:MAG: hypothetical protein AAFQ37_02605 [Bacteroidota bacterium]
MHKLSFLFLVLLVVGCQKYTADSLPPDRLHFGSKGGFTGEMREYILLLDKGRVLFHDPLTDRFEKVGKLDKDFLAKIQGELTALPFGAGAGRPGNINTQLVYHLRGEKQELQWSSPSGAPTPETQQCFEDLMAAVRVMRKTKP